MVRINSKYVLFITFIRALCKIKIKFCYFCNNMVIRELLINRTDMKKFLLSLAAVILAAGTMAAQDMAQATETYNNGAMSLQMGDNASALAYFEQALTMGEACGEEGAELVANCKDIIPQVTLAIAKDMLQAGDYDGAVPQLQKAIGSADQYGKPEVADEAGSLIPQVYMQKGNTLLNAKDFEGAIAAYQQLVAIDSTNGNALLRLGMAYNATGKTAEAEKALVAAMRHGQESQAVKQLSNIYLRMSQNFIKAQKYNEAIDAALKSNEYNENANAMYLAGNASMKLNKTNDAISYYEKYVALNPNAKNVYDIYYTIAVIAQQSGNKEKACGYYQKILSHAKYGATAKAQMQALQCN